MTVSIDLPSMPYAPTASEFLFPRTVQDRRSRMLQSQTRLSLAPGQHDRALLLRLECGDPRAEQRPLWTHSTQTQTTYGLTRAAEVMEWCRAQHVDADFSLNDFLAVQQRQGGTLQASALPGGAFRVWLRGGLDRGGLDPDRQAVTSRCVAHSRRGMEERCYLPDIGTLLLFAQQFRMVLTFKLRGGACVDPHELPGMRDLIRPGAGILPPL